MKYLEALIIGVPLALFSLHILVQALEYFTR